MKLSRFIKIVEKENSIIMFNTINSCIVEMEKNKFSSPRVLSSHIEEDIKYFLKENDFFVSDEQAIHRFSEKDFHSETFHIIISLTEMCNFHCLYCYENEYTAIGMMKRETIDAIIVFLRNTIDENKTIKFLEIDIIGGEPLLAQDALEYLCLQLKQISNVEKHFSIETNGSLLTPKIIELFGYENASFFVSLTPQADHNKMRPFKNGDKSFEKIINNLISCKNEFMKENFDLFIRYNVTHENINDFENFLSYLEEICPFPYRIEIAYANNHSFNENDFVNKLTPSEFYTWKTRLSFKYPELEIINVESLNRVSYQGCFAYRGYGLKIFSDGKLGLCNSWNYYQRRGNILELKSSKEIKRIFPDIVNNLNYSLPQKCLDCENLFLCGGERYCRGNEQCDFIDIDILEYLKNFKGGEEDESLEIFE